MRPGDYLFITVNDEGEIIIRPVKPRAIHPGYGPAAKKAKAGSAAPSDSEVTEEW